MARILTRPFEQTLAARAITDPRGFQDFGRFLERLLRGRRLRRRQ